MFSAMSPLAKALRDVRLSVKYKLFLTLIVTSALTSLVIFFVIRGSLDRGFVDYVQQRDEAELQRLARRLIALHAKEGSWSRLRKNLRAWDALLRGEPPMLGSKGPSQGSGSATHVPRNRAAAVPVSSDSDGAGRAAAGPPRPNAEERPEILHGIAVRVGLYDRQRRPVIGPPEAPEGGMELKQGGHTIGYLTILRPARLTRAEDRRFLREQTQSIALAALAMAMFSLLLSLPVAGYLLRPIRYLIEGTHQLTAGRYDTKLRVYGRDELGQLCTDFNKLASVLQENERARQRWVLDIAHELRTPLSILRGDVEALKDGVREVGEEALGVLLDEVSHLTRLVGDFYELSMSEIGALDYKFIRVDPAAMFGDVVQLHADRFEQKGIEISVQVPEQSCEMPADPDRLQQLFDNLLANSLRYTDAPGTLVVSAQLGEGRLYISLADSAPGLGTAEYERVFDRLYRPDSSRSRATGGVGLGLSIAKNIVDAHGGMITAGPSEFSGVRVDIEFEVLMDE